MHHMPKHACFFPHNSHNVAHYSCYRCQTSPCLLAAENVFFSMEELLLYMFYRIFMNSQLVKIPSYVYTYNEYA